MKTKQCKECHADIPKKVKRCKHCGAKQPVHFWSSPWFYILLFFCFPYIMVMISSDGSESRSSGEVPKPVIIEDKIKLELQSWNWGINHGYAIAEGEVKNISDQKLNTVDAMVKFYAKDGTFISSGSGLVEYQTLLPGQSSPFKVMEPENPLMNTATLEFKMLMGRPILYKKKEE